MRLSPNLSRTIIFMWIVVYIVLGSIDLSFISSELGKDSTGLMAIVEDPGGWDGSSSYYASAVLFSYLPDVLLQPVIFLIGAAALFFFMNRLRTLNSLMIAMYVSLPAILLFLVRLQKETLVVPMSMLAVMYISSNKNSFISKVIMTAVLYSIYAVIVRPYYLIIVAVFLGVLILMYARPQYKFVLVASFCALLFILPPEIFMKIQGIRDIVNYYRVGDGTEGARTAFLNLMTPDNAGAFIVNYFYAFAKLNLAPLFYFGVKEIWLMSVLSIYFYFIYKGIRSEDKKLVICSSVLIAHIAVYTLFEPDLGSYLRHLSSAFLYLTPIMIYVFNKRKAKKIYVNGVKIKDS